MNPLEQFAQELALKILKENKLPDKKIKVEDFKKKVLIKLEETIDHQPYIKPCLMTQR